MREIIQMPDRLGKSVREKLAAEFFSQAMESHKLDRKLKAIDFYQIALSLNHSPDFVAEVAERIAGIYYEIGSQNRAEEWYLTAITINPQNTTSLCNLGSLLHDQGHFFGAVNFYLKALNVDPLFVTAHYNLAITYQRIGNVALSKRHWRRCAKLDTQGRLGNIARQQLAEIKETEKKGEKVENETA